MTASLTSAGLRFMAETILRQPLRLKLFIEEDNGIKELQGNGYKDSQLKVVSIASTPQGLLAAFAPVTFQFSGPAGRVLGSYGVHEASNTILWTDKLEEVFKAVNNGDSLTIEPVFIMRESEVELDG